MNEAYTDFPCDLCGADDFELIKPSATYSRDPIHICKVCGLVQVYCRRSEQAIADSWTHDIYGNEGATAIYSDPDSFLPDFRYTSLAPWSKARQLFVADYVSQSIGLNGKAVCDVGAGQGYLLNLMRGEYGATPFGIEPSPENCRVLASQKIAHFQGVAGDYRRSLKDSGPRFDVATILWTLEDCHSAREMLGAAYDLLKPGGYVVIGEGSRLLVPFKKPLHYYLSKADRGDWHPFHFSYNTLRGMLAVSWFELAFVNQFIDSDYLILIGRKRPKGTEIAWQGDDWREVVDYFERWAADTAAHFADA